MLNSMSYLFNIAWPKYIVCCPDEQKQLQVTESHFVHTEEPILELSQSKKWPKFMFTILEVISTSVCEFIADKLVLVHQRTGIF